MNLERKKLFVILISLFIAMIVTLVIIHAANAKYVQASKTVKTYEAVGFIPARTPVQKDQVKEVQAPASIKGLAADVIGKSLVTSVMPGDLIFQNEVSPTPDSLKPGCVSVTVQTSLASAGDVTAGDTVDVYSAGGNNQSASKLVSGAEVLAVLDTGGNYITNSDDNSSVAGAVKSAGANKVPAAVELMVPADKAQDIITNAKQPGVYLVRVK